MSAVGMAVNQGLRLARGEHGQIVVTAAHCGRCRREVMPRDEGTCGWCNARVVDEDALPAKRLLELLEDEPVATYSAETQAISDDAADDGDVTVGDGAAPAGTVALAPPVSEEPSPAPPRRRRRVEYDPAEIREQLLAFHAEHGREPTFADLKTYGDQLPPALAAVEWRDVAVELGWTDPTAPKRTQHRRTRLVSVPSAAPTHADPPPARSEDAATAHAERESDLTLEELWQLYDAATGIPEALRVKLRELIARASA